MTDHSRLVKMKVTNYGCIGPDGVVVALDDIVCLVGPNNVGKSTVLDAYDAAVTNRHIEAKEVCTYSSGLPVSVELWIHIPQGIPNIDERWKEEVDGLRLVRSKWEWPPEGGAPTRTTWNPQIGAYSPDDKASGLDAVFSSRLPKPFRIGSLEDPEKEHRQLLALVLEPIKAKLKTLANDDTSPLFSKIRELQQEAEKPVSEFRKDVERVQERINSAYRNVFSSSEVRINVSIGDLSIDPAAAISSASQLEIREAHGQTGWSQQGTGSQRALFWSMLEVRSELNRLQDERRYRQKEADAKRRELKKLQDGLSEKKKEETRKKHEELIGILKAELANIDSGNGEPKADALLPGYMLLIDEPETALHPAAIRAAKDHLYSLASDNGWQVMLSTHHPSFVDPLKDHTTIVRLHRPGANIQPNVFRADEMRFSSDDKENLKSLMAFDGSVAEMFFGSRVLIVEGDTETAAFNEVMNGLPGEYPADRRPLIVRARGKATIPTLIRMLTHFKVDFSVLHDVDSPLSRSGDRSGAYTTNGVIAAAVKGARGVVKVIHRCSCPNFEQHHGMALPPKDKPFHAWRAVRADGAVSASVRGVLEELLTGSAVLPEDDPRDGAQYERHWEAWAKKRVVDPGACAPEPETA